MERVPEPSIMNDPDQAASYAGSHLENAYWFFVQYFRKCFPNPVLTDTILDLGCGTAAIPLRLARIFPKCTIHCVDGAARMLAHGKEAARRNGLEQQVHLFHGCLPGKLPLPKDNYGTVISNSFLHHLDDPMVLWQAVRQYGQMHAAVLVMDVLRPADEEQARRIIDNYLPEAPLLLREDMLRSLRAAFTMDEIADQLQIADLKNILTLVKASPFQFAVYGHLG